MTTSSEELARLLTELGPSELALRDWVRPRLTAAIVQEIAEMDYGMRADEYREGIEDVLLVRRLPANLDWNPRAVLELASHRPAPGRGHVARLFACLMLVCTEDAFGPAELLASLVESAVELGPEATGHAVSFLAWCRLHEPGAWRYDEEARPFLTLGLLVLTAADPAVADVLRRAFMAEVAAVSPPELWWQDGTPYPMLREAAGGEGCRTWRELVRRSPAGSDATLRAWFRLDRPARQTSAH